MPIQIEDGKGSGRKMGVNKENQGEVAAITQSELEHESEENGAGYNWSTNSLDLAVNETLLLVKNTSDTPLHIECVKISNGASATQFRIHLPTTEVTPTGTAITGTNLNTASSNVADASAKSNESDNSLGNTVRTLFLPINGEKSEETPGVILGKNKSIAIDCITEPGTAAATIVGHYAD